MVLIFFCEIDMQNFVFLVQIFTSFFVSLDDVDRQHYNYRLVRVGH